MGAPPKASDEQITAAIRDGLTQAQILAKFDIALGTNSARRIRTLALRAGLQVAKGHTKSTTLEMESERRVQEYLRPHGRRGFRLDNGVILAFSDPHYWPGIKSTAHRAFLKFCRNMKPVCVINNGDALDGAQISRWPRIGWDSRPTVIQELEAVTERLQEIEEAAGTRNLYWNLGNHDARFETFLAAKAPEFQGVSGFHLKDHFPMWLPSWSIWVNDTLVVKHRFKSGIHATHNNAMWAGKSMLTGHLHSLKVTPLSDYNGTRFGIDSGTLAQPYGPQFEDYMEDNPGNHRSGFVVLTFWKGRLLWPELAHVLDEDSGLVQFRGQVIEV